MRSATRIFNRQVLRLCKGILKAWEQWVDETECEDSPKINEKIHSIEKQSFKDKDKDKDKEPYDKFVKS